MNIYIYTLSNPVTNEVKYIGQSINPTYRLSKHICDRKNTETHKGAWIKSLFLIGLKPKMEILDEFENKEAACNAEIYWISQFKAWGFNLTNQTPGGDMPPRLMGTANPANRPEVKEKLRRANIGKKHSEETKRKLGERNKIGGKIPPSRKGISSKYYIQKSIATKIKTNKIGRKPIVKLDMQLNFIERFDAIRHVKNIYPSYSLGNIGSVCRKERNHAHGFIWMIENEYNKLINEKLLQT